MSRYPSRQEPAREPARAQIRMEVHVEAPRVVQQLGQGQLGGREVRVRDEDPVLPHVELAIRDPEVDPHRRCEPPDDRAGPLPRVEMVNVPEPNGLAAKVVRSEEHTSELQSHVNLVCRLLLEKKKK